MTITAVVPTLGRSPLLVAGLEALRNDPGEDGLEIVVVDQGERPVELPAGLADRVLRPGRNLGFTGGTNLGIQAGAGDLVATVNDDLVVEPGWRQALVAALARHPEAAAAQGVNLILATPELSDGWGIGWGKGWTTAWQAVQLGHGLPAPQVDGAAGAEREIFGVSATAALYRRAALTAVALPGGDIFDSRLGSYYEDVDLACRLRAAGWSALTVPAARARHAGAATTSSSPARARARWANLYGNRYLVLARLLGARFWTQLPTMALRDLADWLRALAPGPAHDPGRIAGIPAGWARAARRLPKYLRRGGPAVPMSEIERFR